MRSIFTKIGLLCTWLFAVLVCTQIASASRLQGPLAAASANSPDTTVPIPLDGAPITRHYSRDITGVDAMTVSGVLSREQDLYFSSRDGVSRLSGGNFELLRGTETLEVTAMDACDDGSIATGTMNDFGELRRDATGVFRWVSFHHAKPYSAGQIWRVICREQTRYFVASRIVYKVEAGKISELKPPAKLNYAYESDLNVVFVGSKGELYVQGPKGDLVDMPEYAGLRKPLVAVGVRKSDRILFYDHSVGTYQHSASDYRKLEHPELVALAQENPYVAKSPDGESLVVGTLSGQVWWLNRDFKVRFKRSLNAGAVLDLTIDREGAIWAACERGLYSIAWPSNWTQYADDQGLVGNPLTVFRHNGQLHLGASNGLFRLQQNRFENIGIKAEQVFNVVETARGRMIVYGLGVYYFDPHQPAEEFNDLVVDDLHTSKSNPNWLFVSQEDGLSLFVLNDQRWHSQWRIEHPSSIFGVMEVSPTTFFIQSETPFLLELASDGKITKQIRVESTASLLGSYYFSLDSKIYASSLTSMQRLEKHRFVPAQELLKQLPPLDGISIGSSDSDSDLGPVPYDRDVYIESYQSQSGHQWLLGRRSLLLRDSADKPFESVPLPQAGLSFGCMVPDGFSMLFCDTLSLLRLRPLGQDVELAGAKTTRLDRLEVDGKPLALSHLENAQLLPTSKINVHFTSDTNVPPVRYRYRLHKQGEPSPDYSQLSTTHSWSVRDLAPGEYRLEAQAKPALLGFAKPASLRFRVAGSWWQTTVGKVLLLSLGLLTLSSVALMVFWWRTTRLKRNAWQLSAQVEERTRTLSEQALALERANRCLEDMALRDGLTQVANRRHFDERIRSLLEQATDSSVVLLDLDYFKRYNDHFGHLAGDDLLRQCAQIFAHQLQISHPSAFLARFGGEEFAILLPDCDAVAAFKIAESLRLELTRRLADADVSTSAGVAQKRADDSVESLLLRADTALYRAKAAGRNRVEMQS